MKIFFSACNQLCIIGSAVTGTSMMTLYSYFISWIRGSNFKEPLLLGKLTHRMIPRLRKKDSRMAGWVMHYLTGVLFAETYAPFWSAEAKQANIKIGLVLGGLSGIAAILIWKYTLESHPFPPAVDFPRFAGQLFIAHLVFGLFAAVGYNLTSARS